MIYKYVDKIEFVTGFLPGFSANPSLGIDSLIFSGAEMIEEPSQGQYKSKDIQVILVFEV